MAQPVPGIDPDEATRLRNLGSAVPQSTPLPGGNAVPGMSATEVPMPASAPQMAAPGNPNVTNGGSVAGAEYLKSSGGAGPVQAAAGEAPTLRASFNPVTSAENAAARFGADSAQAIGRGASAVQGAASDFGKYVAQNGGKALGPIARYGGAALGVLPHAAAYADPQFSTTDKLRLGATDLLRTGATLLGGTAGASLGAVGGTALAGPAVGAIGGVALGAGGGTAADWLAHKTGDAIFGSDKLLRDRGYDPDQSILKTMGLGIGAARGKDTTAEQVFGQGSAASQSKGQGYPEAGPIRAVQNGAAPAVAAPVANGPNEQAQVRQVDNSTPMIPSSSSGTSAPAGSGGPATPAIDPNAPTGNVLRQGNSYSGSNIAGPISVNGQATGGTVSDLGNSGTSSADRVAQMGRDSQHLRDMAGIQRTIDQNQHMGSGVLGGSAPGLSQTELQDFNQGANLHNAAARGDRAGVAAATTQINNTAKLREMSLQNQGLQQRAFMEDQTSRRGQDIIANTSRANNAQVAQTAADEHNVQLHGQNTVLQGHALTVAGLQAQHLATATALKAQQDREFQRASANDGVTQAESQQRGREASSAALHSEIVSQIPNGPDGKPDTARAAQMVQGMTSEVGQRQSALEAEVARNPSNAGAVAELKEIRTRGVGILGAKQKADYIAGQGVADQRAAGADSAFKRAVMGSRDVSAVTPPKTLRLEKNFLTPDMYVDDQLGRTPAYDIDKEGSFMGFGGHRQTRYDSLKIKQK